MTRAPLPDSAEREASPAWGSWVPVGAALVALVVYWPRVCPTVSLIGDSAVFASAAAVWGVPQPPGYPLFALLGHLLTLVLPGDVAWRVNLSSALFHAGAVGLVALAIREVTSSAVAAIGGSLFLAFSGLFFLGSLYAEAFPLNDLFTALMIVFGLRVFRAPPGASRLFALRLFAISAGTASAHHPMISLATPALACLVVPAMIAELRSFRLAAGWLGLFAVPFLGGCSLILFASARDPWVNWGDVHDVASLVSLAMRADYGGVWSPALVKSEDGPWAHAAAFAEDTSNAFGAVGWGLAALGVAWLWRRERNIGLSVLLGFAAAGPLFAAANLIPISEDAARAFFARFATMAHVFFAIGVGAGLAAIEGTLRKHASQLAPALALVFVMPLWTHSASADLRRDTFGLTFTKDLFRDLPPRAIVMGTGDSFSGAASYACAVLRICEGRSVLLPGQLHTDWRAVQLRRRDPEIALHIHQAAWPTPADVVTDNRAARPVFVTARLLDIDPALREQSGYLPHGMLLRAVSEDEVFAGQAELVADARAMLDPAHCGGCQVGAFDVTVSPLERSRIIDYTGALENHARILELIMGDAENARPVAERARAIAEGLRVR